MTSFVQPDFPRVHGGADRLAIAAQWAQVSLSRLRSPAGLASLLIAGGLAAAVVVAEQVVSAWADGHLLLAWVAMWLIVFGLLVAFSNAIRAWPTRFQAYLDARSRASAHRDADDRTWAAAVADPRLMAELDCAMLRAQQEAQTEGRPMPSMPIVRKSASFTLPARWA